MSQEPRIAPPNETAGILYAGAAYAIWGLFPLYWDLLANVPPVELSIHRMVWCALFAAAVTVARGRAATVWGIVRTRALILPLTVSGLLIAVNWTIYIWSVAAHQLVEASLGYYITPLLSIALGVVMLGEKLSRLRLAAIALASVAVAFKTLQLGHIPWVAIGLSLSFGFYGYVRKRTPVQALDGLAIETGLLFPFTAGAVLYWIWSGTSAFPAPDFRTNALLLLAGPVTAVPLAMFAAGARRIRLTTLGFLQYFSPSITLLVATVGLGEPFTRVDLAAFGCVWIAVILVGIEGQVARSAARQQA
ncbi:MAG: EamA family transporter RarD [Alphaproteobacteria bacterium]|nr:EamA family transporter RarD [Alphaproteobacteria bacterium]